MNNLKCTIRFLLTGLLLAGGLTTQAQNVVVPELKWANGLSGDGLIKSTMQYIDRDQYENIVTAGMFNGTIDFDPTSNANDLSAPLGGIYIWKCDSAGNFLWVKQLQYGSFSPTGFPMLNLTTLSVDKATGDIYITGEYGDTTMDFDPGPGVHKLIPRFSELFGMFQSSVFILKLNASGEFQWAKSLDIYNGGGITSSAIGKSQGEGEKRIYFTGYFSYYSEISFDFDPGPDTAQIVPPGTLTGNFAYVFCLDENGDFGWVKCIGEGPSPSFGPQQITLDNDENIYISGRFTGTFDVNPSPAVYSMTGTSDLFLLKYDHTGQLTWARQSETGSSVYGGVAVPSRVREIDMDIDDQNAVYLALDFNGPINFNKMLPFGGSSTLQNVVFNHNRNNNGQTTALLKYNTDGDFEWVKQIGGTDTANQVDRAMVSVMKDKVFLTGRFNNPIDFDPGPDTFVISSPSRFNGYIAQYDTAGSFLWGSILGEADSAHASPTGINVGENSEDIYLSGTWGGGSIDVDPGQSSFVLTPVSNNTSGFVLKLNISAVDTTTPPEDTSTTITDKEFELQVTVAPNPTAGMLNLTVTKSLNDGIITIRNIAGQTVVTRNKLQGKTFNFNLSDLASGVYLLELREGTKTKTYKLVKR